MNVVTCFKSKDACVSLDPGCRSASLDSEQWVRDNLGGFLEFATGQELQSLNPSITIVSIACRSKGHSAITCSKIMCPCLPSLNNWFPFYQEETLAVLTPTQVGQLALSSGALNDTRTLGKIFDQLQDNDALENVDSFLREVQAGEMVRIPLTVEEELSCCPIMAPGRRAII